MQNSAVKTLRDKSLVMFRNRREENLENKGNCGNHKVPNSVDHLHYYIILYKDESYLQRRLKKDEVADNESHLL